MRSIFHTPGVDLLTKTKSLAATVDFDRAAVCKDLGVSTRWLQLVIDGSIKEPSVVKIQRLHDLLMAKKGRAA